MNYKNLRHTEVSLDSANPRLPDGTASDKEAINRLLDDGYSQLVELAKDLVKSGEANPAELPIVLKDGSDFVVLEGNRRFAALKLLADPMLADGVERQLAFARIAQTGKPPKTIHCAVANSREDADHWITLRHTGANEGVGVKRWSAPQTATHRRRMKAPVDAGTIRSMTIADELLEAYHSDEALVAAIQEIRSAKLTNIGRFFAGDVMTRMQFEIVTDAEEGLPQHTLWVRHTADELHEFFVWAVELIRDSTVDAFKNADLRAHLLNENADLIPAASGAMKDKVRLADEPFYPASDEEGDEDEGEEHGASDPSGGEDAGDSDGGEEGAKEPSDGSASGSGGDDDEGEEGGDDDPSASHEEFMYSKVRLAKLPGPVRQVLAEAQLTSMEDRPYTACILSRVVLELVVSSPDVLSWSGANESDSLKKKLLACLKTLDPKIDSPTKRTRRDLEQAYLETDQFGVRYMHQFFHNALAHADPHLARRFSVAFSPLLTSINSALTA